MLFWLLLEVIVTGLFLDDLVRKHLPAFEGDAQQVKSLGQALQANLVGVLGGLQALAKLVEHLDFLDILAIYADGACDGVGPCLGCGGGLGLPDAQDGGLRDSQQAVLGL